MMKHALARYDAYKDSGVEWLGEVPSHWELKRLKDIASITRGAILRPVDEPKYFDENGHWYYLNISDVTKCKKYVYTARLRLSTLGSTKSARVKAGNLIITASATIGKPFINKVDVCIHDGFIPFKNVTTAIDYFYYFLKNKNIYASIGKTNTQKNIYLDEVKNICIGIPYFKEQNAIAAYLDTKTAQLDCKIDLLTQKATQYGKLKQSLINETVTRGLDKTVVMKDSGVEWLGEVPEQWEVNRLKDIFNERTDKGYPDEPLLIASQDKGVTLKASYSRHTMTVQKNFHTQKLVKKADFVISLRSFEGGIETAHYRGIISAAYTIMYPINEQGSGYYKHLFKSSKFISLLVTHTTGIREGRNINYQQLKRDVIPVPNPVERQKIASYLDTKTAHIDHIIETINTQIDKLKELRTTLINDVVTGKIKVT